MLLASSCALCYGWVRLDYCGTVLKLTSYGFKQFICRKKELCSNSYVMAVLSLTAKCKIVISCFNDDCAVSIRFVLFTFILNASLPCSLICNATGSLGGNDYRVLSKSLDTNRSKIYPEMLSTASIKILQHNRHQNLQNKYWNPELTNYL